MISRASSRDGRVDIMLTTPVTIQFLGRLTLTSPAALEASLDLCKKLLRDHDGPRLFSSIPLPSNGSSHPSPASSYRRLLRPQHTLAPCLDLSKCLGFLWMKCLKKAPPSNADKKAFNLTPSVNFAIFLDFYDKSGNKSPQTLPSTLLYTSKVLGLLLDPLVGDELREKTYCQLIK
ncbi:hypothetical protein Nepgr_024929 [Nepenthes gracilis]|uniref:Uncharacterized protein n=1 Tax=Nepenthes gracilis TaxID=150966 RepID=A0AAD3Y0Z5_NEPGR|nr:hypothetical protein Nepgr_024929 [Nepenthes gracilis]